MREKIADLLIDIAKLVIGGVILSSIISENINTLVLYISGSLCSLILILSGLYLYRSHSKRKEK